MNAEERKRREAEFFDRRAAARQNDTRPINPAILERYSTAGADALYPLEYAFFRTRPVQGRRILVAGCGEGDDAVLFASMGATVMGVDISSGAIEVGKRLASNSGVADRCSWAVAPLEELELAELGQFDVVWCRAILHHLIDDFEEVARGLWACVRPGGMAVAIEPYTEAPLWRWIRLNLLPANPNVTPDERPLEDREMDLLRRYWGAADRRNFSGLARLNTYLFRRASFETASVLRKGFANSLCRFDRMALQGPGSRLGSICVLVSQRSGGDVASPGFRA